MCLKVYVLRPAVSLSIWPDAIPSQLESLLSDGGKVAVIDNTSSDDVAALYPTFLSGGLSVVTPNKKAYSSSLELYRQITTASESKGTKYLNESTVGAGLPIIQTLKDLVQTGDKVKTRAFCPSSLCGDNKAYRRPNDSGNRSSKSKASCPEHYHTSSTNSHPSTRPHHNPSPPSSASQRIQDIPSLIQGTTSPAPT